MSVVGTDDSDGKVPVLLFLILDRLTKSGTEASDGMKKTIGNESSRASKDEAPRVSRSIMIRRPAGSPSTNGTPPESPAGSVTPCSSPFLGKETLWSLLMD